MGDGEKVVHDRRLSIPSFGPSGPTPALRLRRSSTSQNSSFDHSLCIENSTVNVYLMSGIDYENEWYNVQLRQLFKGGRV